MNCYGLREKYDLESLQVIHYTYFVPFESYCVLMVELVFPYSGEKYDGCWVVDPLFNIHKPKMQSSLCQDTSFEPPTVKIGPGIRPVEARKKTVKRR